MATSDTTHLSVDRCPRCFGPVERSATEHVCRDCSLVVEDTPIAHAPDWGRNDDPDSNPERASPSNRLHGDRGLGSQREGSGRTQRRRDRINRHASRSKVDRNRRYATTEIHRMTTALELPRYVGDRAKRAFVTVHDDGLVGRDLDAIAAACLYLTVRQEQLGRTADEIAAVRPSCSCRTVK